MNNLIIKEVDFLGDNLLAIQEKVTGKIYTAINYVLRGLGFDERQIEYQRNKWVEDKVISKGVQKFSYPSQTNGNQETYCISVNKLPLALAKINITPKMENEMPELAEKLETYQNECADILAQVFLPQYQYPQQVIYKKQLDLRAITLISKTTKGNMPVVLQALNKGGYDVEGLDLYIQPHYEVIDSGIIDIVNETKEIINKLLDKNNFLTQYIATNELRKLLYQKRK